MTKPTGHIVERGVENAMLVLLPWLPAYRYRVIHAGFSEVVTAAWPGTRVWWRFGIPLAKPKPSASS